MPLRASNLSYNDLRHVVILGNLEFLRRYNFNYLHGVPPKTSPAEALGAAKRKARELESA